MSNERNLTARRPDYNGPSMSARAQRAPGAVLRRFRQVRGETPDAAMRRAQGERWWPYVVHQRPVLSCGFWVWQARIPAP